MAKRQFWQASVAASTRISPNMQRIILSGDSLKQFPENSESGYIKLLFSHQGSPIATESDLAELTPERPLMRTYTVRSFDSSKSELTVDFALHEDSEGPASTWARNAATGDTILFGGPGPAKLVDNKADWYLIAGDMTALPAISVNLEQLPEHAKGYAIIEVANAEDAQELTKPAGINIHWVEKSDGSKGFLESIYKISWLDGEPYIWCACEFSAARGLSSENM